mmetsp:Transcript_6592/g.20575  ORF Transcript_6592/g.20575 Transcript_6592/m.20575 type:complete len:190 (+) Transcript_6592:609-1178(+)
MSNGSGPGMLEQALVDTAGRCLNGLDQLPDLFSALAKCLKTEPLLANVQAGEGMLARVMGGDVRFLALGPSVATLRDVISSRNVTPWRSTYCMERVALPPQPSHFGSHRRKNVASTAKCRACRVCGTAGRVGKAVLMCKRCKSAIYCSRACQAHDWPAHKRDCVPQRRAPAPGTDNLEDFAGIMPVSAH